MSSKKKNGRIKPRQIVLLIGSLEFGGAGKMYLQLAEYFKFQGIGISLCLMDRTIEMISNGGEGDQSIEILGFLPSRSPTWYKIFIFPLQYIRFCRMVRRKNPDLVLSFMERANIMNLLLLFPSVKRIISVRTSFSTRMTLKSPLKRFFLRMIYPVLLHRAHDINLNSKGSRESFISYFGLPPGRTSMIHNFCDLEGSGHHGSLPPSYDRVYEKNVVVAGGRLVREKGFGHLIRAFRWILDKHGDGRLVIIGDGPNRIILERLALKMGVGDRVFFPGFQRRVAPWIASARVFVLPSLVEGFPNMLLEAMSLGCPVIAADCPSGPGEILQRAFTGVGDTLRYADYGVLIPALSGHQYHRTPDLDAGEKYLVKAVCHLLDSDELRYHYGRLGKVRAEHFSRGRRGKKWMELIDRVCNP